MYQYGSFSYSCDKIKLKGKLSKQYFPFPQKSKIRSWIDYCLPEWCECVKFTECLYAFKYRYSYTLRIKGEKEGVFFIAEYYNGDFREQASVPEKFILEYNPNKSGSRIYEEFCSTFLFTFTEITSFDIAYDIPNANVNDVFINTRADVMTYGKTTNKTLYIAPKEDNSGRVKVYSKHIEREQKGIEIPDTLRIEATIKCKGLDFSFISLYGKTLEELDKTLNHLNSVKIKKQADTFCDWKVFALSRLSPEELQTALNMMSSTPRAKYRKLVCEDTYYTLGLDLMTFCTHISTILTPWIARFKIV